nr:sugar phosphate isomerase/epimerase family protein [Candidatus Sigynarchaeota archaeon]
MKLNFPVSITCNLDPDYSDYQQYLNNLLKFLKPLGYMGIEARVSELEKVPVKKINEILTSFQMKVSALGTGTIYLRYGLSIGSSDEKIRQKAVEKLAAFAGLATELVGVPKLVVGQIRGHRMWNETREDEHVNLIEALEAIDSIANDLGIQVLLEPVNRFETDSINQLSEAIAFIEEGGFEHIFPMIDTFHANIEEDQDVLFPALLENAKSIKHVHIAGCNRRAPAPGCFNFKRFVKSLVEGGYWGYFNVDTIMKPSFEDVAKAAADYLAKIL